MPQAGFVCDGHDAKLIIPTWTTVRAIRIGGLRRYREIIDDTSLQDADEKRCPGKLKRSDPIEVDFIFDPDNDIPEVNSTLFDAADLAMAIEYSEIGVGGTAATPAKITFNGFVSEVTTPELTSGGQMVASLVLVPNGAITHAASVAGA